MKLKSYFSFEYSGRDDICVFIRRERPGGGGFYSGCNFVFGCCCRWESLTKAGEGEGENIDQEDAINSLHVMVFYADGNLQIDKVVAINRVEDLDVQSGAVKILVLANAGTAGKTNLAH